MTENIKPTSFRISESATAKFKELAGELDMTQKDFFDSLLNVYELESSKKNIANRGKEIEEFQQISQRLVAIFLNSLEMNQSAETRIADKYQEELNKKSSALEKIELKLESKKEKEEYLRNNLYEADETINKLSENKKNLESMNANNEALIAEYKEKIDTLSSLVNEYKGYKDDIENVKAELVAKTEESESHLHQVKDLQSQLENTNSQIDFYKNQIEELKAEIKEVKNHEAIAIADVKTEAIAQNEKIKAEFEEKLGFMTDKKDLETEKAIMEITKEHEEAIATLEKKHKAEITKLEKELNKGKKK
ncbi:MAG: hypothetical protein N4A40_14225 [Tissierellales bacterium]|jgi:chromosome segregation ATPase|nr:hypothetical protein [Tissierellales bacterium]